MSSTLSEGVRVPDIGSVNWGADVNFNWGLLNTALANISDNVKVDAENTWTATQTFSETISGSIDGVAARAVGAEDGTNIKTALAGKQPSLSQAQLDAVNSGVTAAAVQQISTNAAAIATKAADNAVVHLAGAETITGDKTFTGAVVTHNITPETDGTYSLGSSTLAWSAVYANTYYYGGTEFQNKFVTADTAQTITGAKTFSEWVNGTGFQQTKATISTDVAPSSTQYFGYNYANNNDGKTLLHHRAFVSANTLNNTLRYWVQPNTSTDDNYGGFQITAYGDGTTVSTFRPRGNLAPYDTSYGANLGASDRKWQSLNGINPGALGMIDTSTYVDIDTSTWVSDGVAANRVYINGANPTFPGYLFIRAAGSSTDFLAVRLAGTTTDKPMWTAPYYPAGGGLLYVIVPCPASTSIRVYTTVAPTVCRYFACLGNV